MKLAMCVGKNKHYRMDEVLGRHFVQTAGAVGVPKGLAAEALAQMADTAAAALEKVESELPDGFPA